VSDYDEAVTLRRAHALQEVLAEAVRAGRSGLLANSAAVRITAWRYPEGAPTVLRGRAYFPDGQVLDADCFLPLEWRPCAT
jgi:hypothetical protein